MNTHPARRRASLAIVLGALALAGGARGWADGPWTPRATLTDERGAQHAGTLRRFGLETAGHPAVVPADTLVLNGVPRKSADLAAIRLAWSTPAGTRGPLGLAVAFEFSDGTSVQPLARGRPAPVAALSIEFVEDGKGPVSWAFKAGSPVAPPLGRITRIAFAPKTPAPSAATTLCVHAFDDANGNGAQDRGEPALADQVFSVSGGRGRPTNLTTAKDGIACAPVPAGAYRVGALPRAGWTPTTPVSVAVTVVPGRTTDVFFGSRRGGGGGTPTGVICVRKFHDLDGNGRQDRGEPGLAGWTFTVIDSGGRASTVKTDEKGDVCLDVPAGKCTVRETPVAGWTVTTLDTQALVVAPKQTITVAFGNRRTVESGTLCVHKFHDLDGNGLQDRREPGLAGWTFTVADSSGRVSTVKTDEKGDVCLDVPPGRCTVRETPMPGWTATTRDAQTVAVAPRQTTNVAFGNRRGKPPGDTLPEGVTEVPGGCDCGLGAMPALNAIVLRWADLCPVAVTAVPKQGGAPVTTWIYGEPRLYRADHGVGNWQRIQPSNGSAGVLVETALESLPIDPGDKELFRDLVRHTKSPADYVETPIPAGSTAAQEAETIRDLAYLVLVTRFGLTLDLMETMGLGLADRNVATGHLYDYILTVWTPRSERLCSRVDGVGPLALPPVPVPAPVTAEPLRSTLQDRPGGRRPDSSVTPIGVTWTSPPSPANPPSPPYARGAFNVIAYLVERRDGGSGPWTRVGEGPILEVSRTDGAPGSGASAYRCLDLATQDGHTYAYRVSALDWIGRIGTPSAAAHATAYAIPAPLPWKAFTAVWNGVSHAVDVTLELEGPMEPTRHLWVERAVPTQADPDAGLTRLNPSAPWDGTALAFTLADAAVAEKAKYEYRIVADGPVAGTTLDMSLRAVEVVPDLTPPAAPAPLQFVLRPGTPLPQPVADALVLDHHADQNDVAKWDAAVQEVTDLIAAERAALLPLTIEKTETVVIAGKAWKDLEVGLDALEGVAPDFSDVPVPMPLSAEILYKDGGRARGLLEELDLDGAALSAHLLPDRAPISCDGRSIPWEETDSVSLLWRTTQPLATDPVRRMAIPSFSDTRGRVAFPQVQSGAARVAVGLGKMHVRLTSAVHFTSAGVPTSGPSVVAWDFDFDHQVHGAQEIRGVRLLGMPWRLGTPGKTFLYRWADPDRLAPPEGRVTRIEIDPTTAAPGRRATFTERKATVTGTRAPVPGGAGAPWSVRGHLVSLGLNMPASPTGPAVGLDLNANRPGAVVTWNGQSHPLADLILVEISWEQKSPVRVRLTFHHLPELRPEHLPQWPDADIKARALSLLEKRRYAPHMTEVLASRETVILHWRYPAPANPADLTGFNVYRATGDAPTVFTRINAEPVPFSTLTAPLASPPAGWPPANANANSDSLCWFEDPLLGGVGTRYSYQVRAVDDTNLESAPNPPTGLEVVVPDRAGPPAPVFVSVLKQHAPSGTPAAFQGVLVEWVKPQHPYDVVLFRKEAGSNAAPVEIHRASPTDPASYVDAGPFLPAKGYEYSLRGDSGTLGKASVTRTVAIGAEDVPPSLSAPLTATAVSGSVQLAWGAPTLAPGVTVTGYVVERRKAGAAAFRLRAGPLTATAFVDDRVVSGTTYDYRVVMLDSNGATWMSLFTAASATVP